MKKTLAYLSGSFVLAMAIAFGVTIQTASAAGGSCHNKCNHSYEACIHTACTPAQVKFCNKSCDSCHKSCS
jgi:hypothetical protein